MDESRRNVFMLSGAALFLLFIVVLAVSSSNEDLEGTSWEMTALLTDGSLAPAIEGPTVSLIFEEGMVSGFGGCNQYFGEYQAESDSLSFGDLASTMAICDDGGVSDQELLYLAHLEAIDRYRLDGDTLWLLTGETVVVELDRAAS